MPESFGARLRQRREEQKIPLARVAEQTKIKQSLLDAFERDDLSHWPSGFFGRAFVRAYAEAIGLNPDVVVREFLALHPEPVDVIEPAPAVSHRGGLHFLVGSAVGSLFRRRSKPAADPVTPLPSPEPGHDLLAVARLCTEFSRLESTAEVQPLLREAAGILDAVGLIVWVWDEPAARLAPALVHGYPDKVVAQLPPVRRDTDNATAAAFRSAQTYAINGTGHACGALVVPLMTPAGCAGVLAIELRHGSEQTSSARAVATILAALLAQLIGGAPRVVEADQEPAQESQEPSGSSAEGPYVAGTGSVLRRRYTPSCAR